MSSNKNIVISYTKKKSSKKRKIKETATTILDDAACVFCLSREDSEVDYGRLIHIDNPSMSAHYFCLFLASGLLQSSTDGDKNTIHGFRFVDIWKEIRRGNKLKCIYCGEKGATIGCCRKYCRKAFHLTCGRRNGTLHLFFDDFRSYCQEHRPKKGFKPGSGTCSICLSGMAYKNHPDFISTSCCKQNIFHRQCLQNYATSSGMYHFKCPMCNNLKDFQKEMLNSGIFIPERDASWETEEGAFSDLYERPNACNAETCVCFQGRSHCAVTGPNKLQICGFCGSFASHRACRGLERHGKYMICSVCYPAIIRVERSEQMPARIRHNGKRPLPQSHTMNNKRFRGISSQEYSDGLTVRVVNDDTSDELDILTCDTTDPRSLCLLDCSVQLIRIDQIFQLYNEANLRHQEENLL